MFSLALLCAVILIPACTSQPRYPAPEKIGANVVVDVASLQMETPRFFTYRHKGRNVSFFVMRMQSGIQSYLDACASCYSHKRGYACDKGVVTCRFCGQGFSVRKLDKGLGGCYPIRLEGRVEQGRYMIPVALLEDEADKF